MVAEPPKHPKQQLGATRLQGFGATAHALRNTGGRALGLLKDMEQEQVAAILVRS